MISYQEYGNENKEPLILLPPGISDSSYWDNVLENFKPKYHIFAIDYPGRKKRGSVDVNNVEGITNLLIELIEAKDLQNINIIGYSLGSAITIEMLTRFSNYESRLNKIVLIAPGEYLKRYRYIINLVFFPAKYSNLLRLTYRRFLLLTGVFKKFPRNNLDIINKQWLSIINWKLPSHSILYENIELINFDRDIIMDGTSKKSLTNIFPKAKIYNYSYSHFLNTNELIKVLQNTKLLS